MSLIVASRVRVLIGTTEGPVELLDLRREPAVVRRSVVSVRGTTERAGIERGYHSFVSSKDGIIAELFGKGAFRADVSAKIDAGSSWQLGFLLAHALHNAGRLGGTHDVILWATGTVRSDLSIGEVGHVPQKLALSLERFRAEASSGRSVLVLLPAVNDSEIDRALRGEIAATGAKLIAVDQVGQALRALELPPVERKISAADRVWHGSPYRRLEPFDAQHRDIFFGRGRAREECLERLRRAAASNAAFLLVHGRSGSGKSSLVRAGLVGDVLAQAGEADIWRVALTTPRRGGLTPMAAVTRALVEAIPELFETATSDEVNLRDAFVRDPAGATELIRSALGQIGRGQRAKLLLVIDQLEELLLWARDEGNSAAAAERNAFASLLTTLCRSGSIWVIATLRSDMLAGLDDCPELSRLATDDRLYRHERPTRVEVKQIVLRPAAAARLALEGSDPSGLAFSELLIEQAVAAPDSLPLLQVMLARLFETEGSTGRLTYTTYVRLGGLEGAIEQWADDAVRDLKQAADTRRVLSRLVLDLGRLELGSGTVVARTLIVPSTPDPKFSRVVDQLDKARLLVRDQRGNDATLRVAHEALLNHWPYAKSLFAAHNRDVLLRDELEDAADRWRRSGCTPALLLSTARLIADARLLLCQEHISVSDQIKHFITSSRRRLTIKRTALFGAAAAIAVIGTVLYLRYDRERTSKDTLAAVQEARNAADLLSAGRRSEAARLALNVLTQSQLRIPQAYDVAYNVLYNSTDRPIPISIPFYGPHDDKVAIADRADRLLILTESKKLSIWTPEGAKMSAPRDLDDDLKVLSASKGAGIILGGTGPFTDGQLIRYDPAGNKFVEAVFRSDNPTERFGNAVVHVGGDHFASCRGDRVNEYALDRSANKISFIKSYPMEGIVGECTAIAMSPEKTFVLSIKTNSGIEVLEINPQEPKPRKVTKLNSTKLDEIRVFSVEGSVVLAKDWGSQYVLFRRSGGDPRDLGDTSNSHQLSPGGQFIVSGKSETVRIENLSQPTSAPVEFKCLPCEFVGFIGADQFINLESHRTIVVRSLRTGLVERQLAQFQVDIGDARYVPELQLVVAFPRVTGSGALIARVGSNVENTLRYGELKAGEFLADAAWLHDDEIVATVRKINDNNHLIADYYIRHLINVAQHTSTSTTRTELVRDRLAIDQLSEKYSGPRPGVMDPYRDDPFESDDESQKPRERDRTPGTHYEVALFGGAIQLDVRSVDGAVVFLDKRSKFERMRFSALAARASAVWASKDLTRYAVGFEDGRLRLWDLKFALEPIASIDAHGGEIEMINSSPSESRILTSDSTGQIRVWPLLTRDELVSAARHTVAVSRQH